MTLRRRTPLAPSAGTTWPPKVRAAIHDRDGGCVGPRIGMPSECIGGVELDHVRASGGLGMKSASTLANGVSLCSQHHLEKHMNGRIWRPRLIDWIDRQGHANCVDPCSSTCPARTAVAR